MRRLLILAAVLVGVAPTPVRADGDYAVFVEQSWITTRAVSDKTPDGFTITFATAAPEKATLDWMLVR